MFRKAAKSRGITRGKSRVLCRPSMSKSDVVDLEIVEDEAVKELEQRVSTLTRERDEARAALWDTEKEDSATVLTRGDKWTEEASELRCQLATARAEATAANEREAESRRQLEAVCDTLAAAEGTKAALQQSLDGVKSELMVLETDRTLLEAALVEANTQRDVAIAKLHFELQDGDDIEIDDSVLVKVKEEARDLLTDRRYVPSALMPSTTGADALLDLQAELERARAYESELRQELAEQKKLLATATSRINRYQTAATTTQQRLHSLHASFTKEREKYQDLAKRLQAYEQQDDVQQHHACVDVDDDGGNEPILSVDVVVESRKKREIDIIRVIDESTNTVAAVIKSPRGTHISKVRDAYFKQLGPADNLKFVFDNSNDTPTPTLTIPSASAVKDDAGAQCTVTVRERTTGKLAAVMRCPKVLPLPQVKLAYVQRYGNANITDLDFKVGPSESSCT